MAELVDNALDAQASRIDITINEEREGGERRISIAVMDNGCGMDKAKLWEALRFGGSERFGERESLGRYGMGLPNSSLSQAPRVDVFTWRRGAYPIFTYLDVEEIASGRSNGVPEPMPAVPPPWTGPRPPRGTLVIWSRCDRLRFKKPSTLAMKLSAVLGRVYRVALTNGTLIRVNQVPVPPVDPLFRVAVAGLSGTCQPFGDPLHYSIRTPTGGTTTVEVQFVELPVSRWHDLPLDVKRATGIVGGAGVSVLRAGREIDLGWHLFGTKRRENYDDWWRCELRFTPALDELVGITHSKQGINPTEGLRAVLEPDLERIARELNARVRRAFGAIRSAPVRGAEVASDRDRLLPPVATGRARRPTASGFQFLLSFHDEPCPEFFRTRVSGSSVRLELNRNHAFYKKSYAVTDNPLALEIMLIAAGRALLDLPEGDQATLLRSWSDNLTAYLGR